MFDNNTQQSNLPLVDRGSIFIPSSGGNISSSSGIGSPSSVENSPIPSTSGDTYIEEDEKSLSATSSDSEEEETPYEDTSTFKQYRENGKRELLKGRRVKILDGKHVGKIGRFSYWHGTVVHIRFKDDESTTGVPISRGFALLKRRRTKKK
jgi:hypothetical protein